ncbi:hypothetical protein HGA91_03390 [candidate division WWE3 bacterium]|nr:hypothetical protein [candidate division WWE3 bacterium]
MAGLSEIGFLERAFQTGSVPDRVDGYFKSQIALLIPKTIYEKIGDPLTTLWSPWKGVVFDSSTSSGDNVISTSYLSLLRVFGHKIKPKIDAAGIHVWPFKYAVERSIENDMDVLKLTYDPIPDPQIFHPAIDEVVQIDENALIGKSYFKEGDNYRLIAYFSLKR